MFAYSLETEGAPFVLSFSMKASGSSPKQPRVDPGLVFPALRRQAVAMRVTNVAKLADE